MFVNIGEKIKNLRTMKGLSQDKFAQYLGVSCRDVVKWESGGGYPDFELIPVIANYFEVTTDELLCMEQFSNEDRIREYLDRFHEFVRSGKLPQAVETMRDGLTHFPNNYRFKCMLMYSLYLSCDRPAAIKHYSPEVIALSEDILASCTDDAIRLEAKRILCLHYYEDLNDTVSARDIARSLPGCISSREEMLPHVSEGENKLTYLAENIARNFGGMLRDMIAVAENDRSMSVDEKIAFYELADKLEELCYPDGDYLAENEPRMRRLVALMELYASKGDSEHTLCCLESAAECALAYDKLPQVSAHTSPLWRRVRSDKRRTDGAALDPRPLRDVFIQDVLSKQCLDFVKYTDRMHAVCDKIAH